MRTVVAGNWKMHKTVAESLRLVDALIERSQSFDDGIDVVIAPPFTALEAVSGRLRNQNRIKLGAQTMHWEDQGAFTGEISPPMLKELGVEYVILGHSERRAFCGETNEFVCKKTHAALRHGLIPIIAVGETLEEKESGRTKAKVVTQTRAAVAGLADHQIHRLIFAYEPIWAIGTGQNDNPVDANATMGEIRSSVAALASVPILYGGSVKPGNMGGYAAMNQINGALVGGASLEAESFAGIIAAAALRRAPGDK